MARPGVAAALIVLVLVIAFSAIDYLLRPRLPAVVGDNDVYVMVIVLALEFVVIWRTIAVLSSPHRRQLG